MAKLKNFTLEGEALRVIAYRDHKGVARYELEVLPKFQGRDRSEADLMAFIKGLKADVEEWGGLFHRSCTGITNTILGEFVAEGNAEDGIRMQDVPKE